MQSRVSSHKPGSNDKVDEREAAMHPGAPRAGLRQPNVRWHAKAASRSQRVDIRQAGNNAVSKDRRLHRKAKAAPAGSATNT